MCKMEFQASSLFRVLACNGSILLGKDHLPNEPQTDDAIEGIAAHFVASSVLAGQQTDPLEWVERSTPAGYYVTPDMAEFVSVYTNFIAERDIYKSASGTETTCDFESGPHVVRCRVDHWSFTQNAVLNIDDFKYGFRLVEPDNNWQLIAGAIGLLNSPILKAAKVAGVMLNVVQPRPFHRDGPIRKEYLSLENLRELRARLDLNLASLDDQLRTGEHCRECPAIYICPAARMAGLNAIEASSVAFTEEIPDDALSFELDNLERASNAIKLRLQAATELATHRAKSGRQTPGRALEMQYGHRAWKPGINADMLAMLAGKPADEFKEPQKLVSPAQAQKRGISETVVNGLADRPMIGIKLVKSDPNKRAKQMFGAQPSVTKATT